MSTVKPLDLFSVNEPEDIVCIRLDRWCPLIFKSVPCVLNPITLLYSFHVSCLPMPYSTSNAVTKVPCHHFVLSNRCLFFHCNMEQVTLYLTKQELMFCLFFS